MWEKNSTYAPQDPTYVHKQTSYQQLLENLTNQPNTANITIKIHKLYMHFVVFILGRNACATDCGCGVTATVTSIFHV